MKLKKIILCTLLFFASVSTVYTDNKVIVVPLIGKDYPKNLLVVSKKDGDFSDPVTALKSIYNASEQNPYKVFIMEGEYVLNETLIMKEYVDIIGSGRETTKLIGRIGVGMDAEASAIVIGVNNSTIRNISIENIGNADWSIAILSLDADSLVIEDVLATASGATNSIGIYVVRGGPTIRHVTSTGNSIWYGAGIANRAASTLMTNVIATGTAPLTSNGVANFASSNTTMINVIATASGGQTNIAVNNSRSTSSMKYVTATSIGGMEGYGIRIGIDSAPPSLIEHSTVSGSSRGIRALNPSGTNIRQSRVTGGISGADLSCFFTVDDLDNLFDNECSLAP